MLRSITPRSSKSIAYLTFKHSEVFASQEINMSIFPVNSQTLILDNSFLNMKEKEVPLPQIDYKGGECVCSSSDISI